MPAINQPPPPVPPAIPGKPTPDIPASEAHPIDSDRKPPPAIEPPPIQSRGLLILLLLCITMVGPFSTNMYLPSMADMTQVFNTSVSMVQLTVSVYTLGLAVGILFYGPLSDRFGRRPVILASLVIFLVASLACVFATSIEFLIAARFFQAIGACGGGNIGRAIVRDSFPRNELARILSYIASAIALAPALAPILGGYLHTHFGWQSNFVTLAGIALGLLALCVFFLKESNRHKDKHATDPIRLYQNAGTLVRDRCYLANMFVVGLSFGGSFSYVSNSSFIFINTLKLSATDYGHTFLALAAFYLAGALTSARFAPRLGSPRMVSIGIWFLLISGVVGATLAWLRYENVWTVLPFGCLQYFAAALIQPNAQAGAITPYPRMAGTASSLLGFSQMTFGAGVGYLVSILFEGTTRPLMTTMLVLALISATLWALVRPRGQNACAG